MECQWLLPVSYTHLDVYKRQVCTEREILKQYFNVADMDGFDYAYLYPGMNKVLQSAGRVIRTESDRGVILLLDDRFRAMRYREVFPREWPVSYTHLDVYKRQVLISGE